jgi:hypothetical protein
MICSLLVEEKVNLFEAAGIAQRQDCQNIVVKSFKGKEPLSAAA